MSDNGDEESIRTKEVGRIAQYLETMFSLALSHQEMGASLLVCSHICFCNFKLEYFPLCYISFLDVSRRCFFLVVLDF